MHSPRPTRCASLALNPRLAPLAALAGALALSAGCQGPTVEPAPPAPPAPVSEAPPPPTEPPSVAPSAAPSAALPPDLGFTIVAGTPTIVAETPVVTPEARGRAPKAASPVSATPGPSPAAPAVAQSPGRPAEVSAQTVIHNHAGDIEACYGAVALKDPSIAGHIVVQWTLGADGTPTSVAITQDTLRSAPVTDCIKSRARSWKFAPPAGGIGVIRFPYDLKVQ